MDLEPLPSPKFIAGVNPYELKWILDDVVGKSIETAQRKVNEARLRMNRLERHWGGEFRERESICMLLMAGEIELEIYEVQEREKMREHLKNLVMLDEIQADEVMKWWLVAEEEMHRRISELRTEFGIKFDAHVAAERAAKERSGSLFDNLKRLVDDELYISSAVHFTTTLFADENLRRQILDHQPFKVVETLDMLQGTADRASAENTQYPVVSILLEIAGTSGLYPRSLVIPKIDKESEGVVGRGGFGLVYQGELKGRLVALKRIKKLSGSEKQLFIREALVWRQLKHPNILPFLGIYEGTSPSIVTPWMNNGPLDRYLKNNPNTDRFFLLIGVARSLKYIHNLHPVIVHGDLKASNVLVDDFGEARLTDFGLTWVVNAHSRSLQVLDSRAAPGTRGWQAPELTVPNEDGRYSKPTPMSDVYAFGLLSIEVYEGDVRLVDGRHNQPPCMPDALWYLIKDCLVEDPDSRPSSVCLVSDLEGLREEES